MHLEKFLELFIDSNLVLLTAAASFLAVEFLLTIAGFRKSYSTRLWLLTASLGFAALLPVFAYLGSLAQLRAAPHISDILVTQYLKGNISISAVNFDNLLTARTSALQALHSGSNYWVLAAVLVLLAGILGRFFYIFLNILRINEILRNGCRIRSTSSVEIIVSSSTNVPFSTRGLNKFYVVIPQSLLGDYRTLSIAIGHEFQHIRQRDVTIEFLLALASPLFVFNPGFWVLSQKLRRLREHTCDIEYLSRSHTSAADYAKALLSVARRASLLKRMNRVGSLSVPFIGRNKFLNRSTKSQLASRVLAFADEDNRKPHKLFAGALLASASALMLFGASLLQPNSGWSHDRIMLSSVANLERLSLRNQAQKVAAVGE